MSVAAAVLLAVAALVWPRSRATATHRAWLALEAGSGGDRAVSAAGVGRVVGPDAPSGWGPLAAIWNEDPVEVVRARRLRRRPDGLLADALQLLSGIAPGLAAGLPPARAVEVAVAAVVSESDLARARLRQRQRGSGPVGWGLCGTVGPAVARGGGVRRGARGGALPASASTADGRLPDIALLAADLLRATETTHAVSHVWREWSARTGSAELAFVAAAWRLSETTGAPLAAAVERAVGGMRDAGRRRGKVAAAVAGPQATVTVLTVLPLTGPLFGLACGIDPVTLYARSPLATASVLVGLALVWVGRRWSSGMVRTAVQR